MGMSGASAIPEAERPAAMVGRLVPSPVPRGFVALLCGLLVADLLLIGMHGWHVLGTRGSVAAPAWVLDARSSLERDRGFAEIVIYAKLSIAGLALLGLAQRRRAAVLAAWALTLVVVVADDANRYHERWGVELVDILGLTPALGLRARDFGELLVWAGLAAVLLPLIVAGHWCSPPWARAVSWRLAGLLAALALFGAVVDMAHIWFLDTYVVGQLLAVFEDGGELVVSSVIVAAVLAMARLAWPREPHQGQRPSAARSSSGSVTGRSQAKLRQT